MAGKQHELVRDACVTIGRIIEKRLPGYIEGRKAKVLFDPPSDEKLADARKDGTFLLSLVWLDSGLSKHFQTTNQPIVHEEDEDGNIVEYRLGPPTFITSRYMLTPWSESSLDAQVAAGAVMSHFMSFPEIPEEDLQGTSIRPDDKPSVTIDENVNLDAQMKLWQLWSTPGRTYRPSIVVCTTLRMDSLRRTTIRRVREKVNVFRKVEG